MRPLAGSTGVWELTLEISKTDLLMYRSGNGVDVERLTTYAQLPVESGLFVLAPIGASFAFSTEPRPKNLEHLSRHARQLMA